MRNTSRQELDPLVAQVLAALGERSFATGSITFHFHEGVTKSIEIVRVHRPSTTKETLTVEPEGAQNLPRPSSS